MGLELGCRDLCDLAAVAGFGFVDNEPHILPKSIGRELG